MLRIAAITLALCLAACAASGSAEQEPGFAPSREIAAGIQPEGARAIHPDTFVCVPKLNPARQPIPPGKQIKDLCPPGTSALLFPEPGASPRTGTVIHPTTFACFPHPHQSPRPIPPGKKTEDLCPPGSTAWLFLDPVLSASHTPPQTQPGTVEKSPQAPSPVK